MARDGNARPSYLALFAVVVAGVTVGNLASDWIGAQLLAYRAEQAMGKNTPLPPGEGQGVRESLTEMSKSAASSAARARDAAIAQAQKAAGVVADPQEYAREQRRRDRQGVRLFQTCDEWRKAHAQLDTETTGAEMKRHCGLYERYVEHGILPAKK